LGTLLCAVAASGCGFGSPTVVRVVDGKPIEGDFIDPVTYSLFARGAYHEHRGELDHAQRAYEAAAERDPESPGIWARLGAVLCEAGAPGHERAFALAEHADAEFAPLWYERARCALKRGEGQAALSAAERAVELEPSDEDNSIVLAEAFERLGRTDDALRFLSATVVARPSAVAAWNALSQIASRHGRRAELHRAEQALARLSRAGVARIKPPPERGKPGIDEAISAGELERARRLAIDSKLPADELAVRAAALGRAKLASEQAELVLAADPSNGNAWVAALVAADLVADAVRFEQALGALERDALLPGPLAARLMADLLARRVNPEAAKAWLTAYGPLPPPSDALEKRVAERLGPS
jgi:tetratricopeptide (TPR) repeat protein